MNKNKEVLWAQLVSLRNLHRAYIAHMNDCISKNNEAQNTSQGLKQHNVFIQHFYKGNRIDQRFL